MSQPSLKAETAAQSILPTSVNYLNEYYHQMNAILMDIENKVAKLHQFEEKETSSKSLPSKEPQTVSESLQSLNDKFSNMIEKMNTINNNLNKIV